MVQLDSKASRHARARPWARRGLRLRLSLLVASLAQAALVSRIGWAAPSDPTATAPVDPAATAATAAAPTPVESDARRIAVLRFTGPDSDVIRSAAVDALAENFMLAIVSIGLVETQRNLPDDLLENVAELGQRMNLAAAVRGRVVRSGKGRLVTLTVIDGQRGAVLGQVSFRARSVLALHTMVRAEALARLGPLIHATTMPPRPPPATEPTANSASPSPHTSSKVASAPRIEEVPRVDQPPERNEPVPVPQVGKPDAPVPDRVGSVAPSNSPNFQSHDEPSPRAPAKTPPDRCGIIDFEAGGGILLRRFDYQDEQRGPLRGYTLKPAPGGHIEGTFYPIAEKICRSGVAFGLRGAYELMAPVTSHVAERTLETSGFAYQAELVLRISLGALTLKPSAGYFARRFMVEGDVVPSVAYQALGGALDVAYRLNVFSVEFGAGARHVLSAGELTSANWFPQATGLGYAARARLGVAVTDWLDFVVGAQAEYVSLRLNATGVSVYPNGVATGAHDLYFMGLAGLRVRLPGHAP